MTHTIKSSGFITFRRTPAGPLFLLMRSAAYRHWDFPKGHIAPNEDEMACALRELREESGIRSLKPLTGFRKTIRYRVREKGKDAPKQVVYFLGETQEDSVRLSPEHSEYRWAPLEEAITLVQFGNSRRLLKQAAAFIASRKS